MKVVLFEHENDKKTFCFLNKKMNKLLNKEKYKLTFYLLCGLGNCSWFFKKFSFRLSKD